MKKILMFFIIICFSNLVRAASLKRAQYFDNTEVFFLAYKSLTKNYDLVQQTLVSGPYIDNKTKEEFVVIEVEEDVCKLLTRGKSKDVSCEEVVNSKGNAKIPMLPGFEKAENSQFDFLLSLNGQFFESTVTINNHFTGRDISFSSSITFDFSSQLKKLQLISNSKMGNRTLASYPTLVIKSIQYKKVGMNEEIIIWVDNDNLFYSQKSSKGSVNYLNPKLFTVAKLEDLYDISQEFYGPELSLKEKFRPMIQSYDFNYILLKRTANKKKLSIEFQQSFKGQGALSAYYLVK